MKLETILLNRCVCPVLGQVLCLAKAQEFGAAGIKVMKNKRFFAIIGATLIGCSTPVAANEELALLKETESGFRQFSVDPVFPAKEPIVLVIEQNLTEFLELVGKFNGYEVRFSSPVAGTLRDASLPMNIHKIMPELGRNFDLKWHIRPKEMFVSKASEESHRVLALRNISAEELTKAIEKTDISSDAYSMVFPDNENTVHVVGPPSYLDGITLLVEELNKSGEQDD
ncbi:MAG: hypothetical protein ACR2O3_04910 [Rhizobiaceae bacterium]